MKKSTMRVLSLVMALMMIVGTLAVVPFSAATATEHKHTKGNLVETVAPTCALYGYSVYKCADCGESYITDVTDKLEHVPEEVGEVLATCEAEGHTAGSKCALCGEILDGCEVLPKTHEVAYKIVGATEEGSYEVADCLEGLKFVEYCKKCGEILNKDDGYLKVPHPHTLKATVIEKPTCDKEGLAKVYCEECKFEAENIVIEKIDHDWEIENVKATFEADAYDRYVCKNCGAIKKSSGKEVKAKTYANTSHAFVIYGKTYEALKKELKAGETKTWIDTMAGDREVTYTRPACEHNWTPVYLAFVVDDVDATLPNGETVKVSISKKSTDADYKDNAEKFVADYAKYCDISDLTGKFYCPNCAQEIDGKTIYLEKEDTLLSKVDHQYVASYTFRFKWLVPIKSASVAEDKTILSLVSYVETFTGGFNRIVRKCGEFPVRQRLCAICLARNPATPVEVIKVGDRQEHEYTWICQNADCNENVFYVDADGNKVYDILIGTEVYYVCTNCTHERKQVCFNEDTNNVAPTAREGICLDGINSAFTTDEHDAFIEGVTKTFDAPATCVKPAHKYYICSKCGSKIEVKNSETGDIDASNHDWSIHRNTRIITDVAPTCITEGVRIRYCNNYSCKEFVTEPIEALGDKYHTFDKYVAGDPNSILRTNDTGAAVNIEIKRATCANPETWKLYCKVCKKMVWVVNPAEKQLDRTKLESHDTSKLKTIGTETYTCTTDAKFAYQFCEACGTIIRIDYNNNGTFEDETELVVARGWNISKDLGKVVNTAAIDPRDQLFLEVDAQAEYGVHDPRPTWRYAYMGDNENAEYEAIRFADGSVMCYYLKHGIGHYMGVSKDAQKQTCFQAGWDTQYKCQHTVAAKDDPTGFVDKDDIYSAFYKVVDGVVVYVGCTYAVGGDQIIPPTRHQNRKLVEVKAGDEDRVGELEVTLNKYATDYENDLELLALHGLVKNEDGSVKVKDLGFGFVTYYVNAVLPTCDKDGYVLGYYCEDCLGEIADEEGNMIPYEEFVNVLDNTHRELHLAGYKLNKLGHAYAPVAVVNYRGQHACGEEYYTYTINRCIRCENLRVANYADAEFADHKFDAWTYAEDKPEGVNAGDAKIYKVILVNGEYVELEAAKAAGLYVECRDVVYNAKKCVNYPNDEFYYDAEALPFLGHYTTKYVGDSTNGIKEKIDITCKGYTPYIGIYCDCCGYEVPNVIVEKNDQGIDVETYYTKDGEKLSIQKDAEGDAYYTGRIAGKKYFALAHDWAFEQDDCEAIDADIVACAVCGINVVNEAVKQAKAAAKLAAAVEALGTEAVVDDPETTDVDESAPATGAYKELADAQQELANAKADLATKNTALATAKATLDGKKAALGTPDDPYTLDVDEATGAFKAVTTAEAALAAAKKAYNDAKKAHEDAVATLGTQDDPATTEENEATGAYKDYDDAVAALAKAQADYNAAQIALTDAQNEYNAAAADYNASTAATAAQYQAIVDRYNKAVADLATAEGKFNEADATRGTEAVEDDPATTDVDETAPATGAYKARDDAKANLDAAIADEAAKKLALDTAKATLGTEAVVDNPETTDVDETAPATGAYKALDDAEEALRNAANEALVAYFAFARAELDQFNAEREVENRDMSVAYRKDVIANLKAEIARQTYDADEKDNQHEYYLRNDDEFPANRVRFGNAKTATFTLDRDFAKYAFYDVTYPTASEEGYGVLYCVICGKKKEVTIPVYDVVATADFDSDAIAVVNGKATATVKISAKNFEFNALDFNVTKLDDRFELIGVEILYAFNEVDGMDVKINENKDGFTLTKTGSIKPVAISGNNTPFVRLTFKIGDLTNSIDSEDNDLITVDQINCEITAISGLGITAVTRYNSDVNGNRVVKEGYFDTTDCGFRTLKVYNPAYKYDAALLSERKANVGSSIKVLAEVYSIAVKAQYDFNADGRVDLDDYFEMVDFVASNRSIADFCDLINYDVEAMLDELNYDRYRSGLNVVVNNTYGNTSVGFTEGTEADINDAKAVVRKALNDANYYELVEDSGVRDHSRSIKEFAQDIVYGKITVNNDGKIVRVNH